MIPQQPPVVLIIAMLSFGAVIALAAVVASWHGASRLPANRRTPAYALAFACLAVSAACGVFITLIGAGSSSAYSEAVSQVLEERYGVTPLDRQAVAPGTQFKALLDGKESNCTAAVPDIVVCDGVRIQQTP